MPQFPSRDLSNQYISTSYQDVTQRYNDGTNDYILDGLGNVITFMPVASIGNQLITIDQTIPTASYAVSSVLSEFSDTASIALYANYAGSSSWAPFPNNVVTTTTFNNYTSSNDATVNALVSATSSYITNNQTASMSVLSSSFANTASYLINYSIPTIVSASISSSWASSSLSASLASSASYLIGYVNPTLVSSSISSSWASSSLSSSFAFSASYATIALSAFTSSYELSSSYALFATSASNALISNTASYAYTSSNSIFFNGTSSGIFATTASNNFIGIETISGSLLISGSTTQTGNNTLYGNTILTGSISISGSYNVGMPSINIYGDTGINGLLTFYPTNENINTGLSASYLFVSGSTNDLYFSQNGSGYSNVVRLRWLEGNLYTGLLYGGMVTSASATTFNISSGSGVIVSLNATINQEPFPTVQYVSWGNLTNQPLTYLTTAQQTYIAINSSGSVVQQTVNWVDGNYNSYITLGIVLHQNQSTINATVTNPDVAYGYKQRTYDFIKAFGGLKLSGYTLSTSGSLGLTIGSGSSWSDGRNYLNNPNNPSYIGSDPGTNVSKIYRFYQSGSTFVLGTNGNSGYPTIDTTNYNSASSGVLTTVGTGNYQVQRVFWYPNSPTKAIVVYYGTQIYSSLNSAVTNYIYENFTEAPNTADNAIYIGAIAIRGGYDFTTPNNYQILPGGLFRNIGGNTGGGGVVNFSLSNLSDVSESNVQPGNLLMYTTNSVWTNSNTLTGSYTLSGSLTTTGAINALFITSSLYGTSSWSNNSQTASFITASNVIGSVASASYGLSSSYASISISSSLANTASFINASGITSGTLINSVLPLQISVTGITASLNGTSSNSVSASYAYTSSYSGNSSTASYITASNIIGIVSTASYATVSISASYGYVTNSASNINYNLDLSSGSNGYSPTYVNSNLTYNPSTGLLSTNNLSASGNITASAALINNSNNSVLIGSGVALGTLTGSNSVIVGYHAGQNITTATNTTLIGANAGLNTINGTNNTCIGANADILSGSSVTCSIAIGYGSTVSGNNQCVIGGTGSNAVSVGIGSNGFTAGGIEALLVSGSTYNIIGAYANINNYSQLNVKNYSSGISASTDIVATNNNGTEYSNYVNLGINSSGFNGYIGQANDAYLYNTGSNFYIGNSSPLGNLYLFAGASTTSSVVLTPSGSLTVNGTISSSNMISTNITASNITASGNILAGGFKLYDSGLGRVVTITCNNGILQVN